MGLKTTNYQLSNFDTVLPTAYAIIDEIIVERNSVSVTFGIYASRQKASNYKPLETKTVHFVWDRKSDIAVMAYEMAKGQTIIECENLKQVK